MASALASPASTLPLKVDDHVEGFGTVKAVFGVSLDLHLWECLGLLGPKDAGQARSSARHRRSYYPRCGRISIFDSAAGSAEARAAIGWVPQDLAVFPLPQERCR